MKHRAFALIVTVFWCSLAFAETPLISWERALGTETFSRAAKEQRLVILDLEAVWCHWCHVMDEKTYSRKDIAGLISERFIPVRIDQDARPDLGNRYKDYGWPATIIFDSKGTELEKLTGFVEPDEMQKILSELANNPVPRTQARTISYTTSTSLPPELRSELIMRHEQSTDRTLGGLKTSHKYLEADTIELAMKRAAAGDKADEEFVKKSLAANVKLFDPVWGGVYQYSTHADWDHPHFEKLTGKQAENLRLYALAFALWKDDAYAHSAEEIRRYLNLFLRDPSGAYYTSQDADVVKGEHSSEYFTLPDAERRKQGIPAIDRNVYASENGKVIAALAAGYAATGKRELFEDAERAAGWILEHRALPGGGFRHGESDVGGPYLCDSLYFGDGLLRLYAVTGRRELLTAAEGAAKFLGATFAPTGAAAGFVTSKPGVGVFQPLPLVSENIAAVRFLSSLAAYTGNESYKTLAQNAMRYLATKEIATESITEAGIVLADDELSSSPTHITVVAPKSDAIGLALFQAALAYPAPFKRTEWWDRTEGPMPNPDVQYPPLPKPAAFVCTNKRCSLPIFEPSKVGETVRKLSSPSGA